MTRQEKEIKNLGIDVLKLLFKALWLIPLVFCIGWIVLILDIALWIITLPLALFGYEHRFSLIGALRELTIG